MLCATGTHYVQYTFIYCTQINDVQKQALYHKHYTYYASYKKSAIRVLKRAHGTLSTVHVNVLYTYKFRPKHRRFNIYTLITERNRNKYISLIKATARRARFAAAITGAGTGSRLRLRDTRSVRACTAKRRRIH